MVKRLNPYPNPTRRVLTIAEIKFRRATRQALMRGFFLGAGIVIIIFILALRLSP